MELSDIWSTPGRIQRSFCIAGHPKHVLAEISLSGTYSVNTNVSQIVKASKPKLTRILLFADPEKPTHNRFFHVREYRELSWSWEC